MTQLAQLLKAVTESGEPLASCRDLDIVLTSQTTAMRQRADDAPTFGVKQGLLSTNIAGLVSSISTGHIRLLAGRPCKNPGFSSLAKMIQNGNSFVLLSTYAAVGLLGALAVEEFISDTILPTSTYVVVLCAMCSGHCTAPVSASAETLSPTQHVS